MELPKRINWHESSGPVSPAFQYRIDLEINAEDAGANVSCEIKRGADAPVSKQQKISNEQFSELWSKLAAQDVLKLNADLIGDEKRRRVGVSFNSFELEMPNGERVRFDYLRAQLEQPEYARFRAVIEALRAFVESILTTN
jgi:hypothetical protein